MPTISEEGWSRIDLDALSTRRRDLREEELRWFAEDLASDPSMYDRKVWLHSRWYSKEQFDLLLDIGERTNSRFTFAFLGRDLPFRESEIARMIASGHEVILHGTRHHVVTPDVGREEISAQLLEPLTRLRGLGADANGIWLGGPSVVGASAREGLRDLQINWFTGGFEGDLEPAGPRYVPDLQPHDYRILFVDPVPPLQALKTWREMLGRAREGIFHFLPFVLTMLDREVTDVWERFLDEAGGSVPVREFPDPDGRPAIILDASLHLHLQ